MLNKFLYKLLASHLVVLLTMVLLLTIALQLSLPKLIYTWKVQELLRTGEYLVTQSLTNDVGGPNDALHVRYVAREMDSFSAGPPSWLSDEQWNQLNEGQHLAFQRERMHFSVPMTVVFLPAGKDRALMIGAPLVETEDTIHALQKQIWNVLALSMLIALILSLLLSQGLQKRIKKMKLLAEKIAKGDYTIRILAEGKDEIAQLSSDLNEMAEKLEEAQKQSDRNEQLRSKFLADISHELKTPLTSIRGLIRALREQLVDEQEKERIYFLIEKETLRLIRLVQSVMNLEKIRSGQISLSIDSLLLAPLLTDIVGQFSILAEEKDLQISVDCPASTEIWADEDQLRQMLINLVKNAIQFTKKGEIQIRAAENSQWTQIAVCDTGIGISAKEQQDIFERFYKVDPSRSDSMGEMGLGLALVKQLALAHGGEINVESEVGKGSVFTLYLPKRKSGPKSQS